MTDTDQNSPTFGKPWYASKGVWGGIVSAGAGIAGVTLHVHASATDLSTIVDSLTNISIAIASSVSAIGSLLAIYGRLTAKQPIVKK